MSVYPASSVEVSAPRDSTKSATEAENSTNWCAVASDMRCIKTMDAFPMCAISCWKSNCKPRRTIDLGLVRPDSTEPLDVPQIVGRQIRHCDVRYAIFYASNDGATITLTHFFLTTGQAFFGRFAQFQGKVPEQETSDSPTGNLLRLRRQKPAR